MYILTVISMDPVSAQLHPRTLNQDSLRMVELFDQAKSLQVLGLNMEAMSNAEDALQLAMTLDQKHYESRILEVIGDIYSTIGEPASSIPYYLRTSNFLEIRGDTVRLARVSEKIAQAYEYEMVHDKELEYLQKAFNYTSINDSTDLLRLREAMALSAFNSSDMNTASRLFQSLLEEYPPGSRNWLRTKQYMVKVHHARQQYDSALMNCQDLLAVYEERDDLAQQFRLQNNIGYYQTLQQNFRSATRSYEKAIEAGRVIKAEPNDMGFIIANAGVCYQNMEDMDNTVLYLGEAIQLFNEAENYSEESRVENMLAIIYFKQGDLYNAGEFASRAISSAQQAEDPERLADAYNTYSQILRDGNDPINALDNYEKYLRIRDSLALDRKVAEQELEQRRLLLEKEERDLQLRLKEEEVSDLAIKQLRLQNEKIEQEKALLLNEKNLQDLEQKRLEQDNIIATQKLAAYEQEAVNRELEKAARDAEIEKERALQKEEATERENQILEKQQALDQAELDKQAATKRAFIYIAIAGFLVALIILLSLISSRKKNLQLAKQKTEIEEKNIDLEQKNEEISTQRDEIEAQRNLVFEQKEAIEAYNVEVMKSIEYAKRIQSSTLPNRESLLEHVADSFVLFRPRDVVSGDFFWYANVEGKSVFVVADSTGHGVPGAFMSMMGVSILKEIVQKEYLTHPGVILRRMRKEIINTMGQKGISGEQRDGYDIALITIDHEEKKVDYAGAYNSLYLIRNKDLPAPELDELKERSPDSYEDFILYEISADKMPIAHYDRMDKFINKEFTIFEGDQFYMFTDGYADQFGGEKGKKFMYKPFKELLLANAQKPMSVQHKMLNDTITDWMGITPQIDDICIMGVKV